MFLTNGSKVHLDPMRILALYLASYVDNWDGLVTLHAQTVSKFPATTDEKMLIQAISPALINYLELSEQVAVNSQDIILHSLAQSSIEAFRNQTAPLQHYGREVANKINGLPPTSQSLIEAYYVKNLRGTSLANIGGVAEKDLPAALCRVRSQLDWVDQTGVWQVSDAEGLLPSLFHEFINGSIDRDSRELLANTCSKDLKKLVGLQRQWRLPLLLMAMYVSLPFPPKKNTAHGSNFRQKGIAYENRTPAPGPKNASSNRHRIESSASNRAPAIKSRNLLTWFIAGGCFVIAAIMSIILLGGHKPSDLNPLPVNQNIATEKPINSNDALVITSDESTLNKPVRVLSSLEKTPEKTTIISSTTTASITQPITQTKTASARNTSRPIDNTVIDILALVDIDLDAYKGGWEKGSNNSIIIRSKLNKISYSRLQLPYIVPDEYDITVTFSPMEVTDDIVLILNKQGQQFTASIGLHEEKFAGFSQVNNKKVNENATTVPSPIIQPEKQYTMMVKVRKESSELLLDGVLISAWEPKNGSLSLHKSWNLSHDQAIGVGLLRGSIDIHSIGIREITGTGRPGRFEKVGDESGIHPQEKSSEKKPSP